MACRIDHRSCDAANRVLDGQKVGEAGQTAQADTGLSGRQMGNEIEDRGDEIAGGRREQLGAILPKPGTDRQRYSSVVVTMAAWLVRSQWSGVTVTQPSAAASRSVLWAGVCGMPASLIQ